MAIKVIVELQVKPGKRTELKNLLESVATTLGQAKPGFLGSTRYEVLDNPDIVVRLPIGSRPRCGRRRCSRPWPAALMHLWGSC